MKCADCRWYNYDNEVCLKDGYSVFNPDANDPCEYADNMTIFDRITASPDVLAKKLVYEKSVRLICAGYGCDRYEYEWYWYSTIIPDAKFDTRPEAIAATVAKLKEIAQ